MIPETTRAYPNVAADETLELAQITDTHLFAEADRRMHEVDTRASLISVIKALTARKPPDLVLATGDLAQDESLQAYRHFAAALSPLPVRTLALAGNHDNVAHMTRAFAQTRISLDRQTDIGGWRVIQLHSPVPNQTFGHLEDAELARLDEALNTERLAVVCLHHPPLEVGSPWLDEIGLTNTRAFFDVLDRHRNVRAVIAGHVHQENHTRRDGVDYFTTPATSVQFRPGRVSPDYVRDGAGYRRFKLHPDGRVESDVVRIDR